jgi:uncharacterized membrane protein SpoIIM required for sporulation
MREIVFLRKNEKKWREVEQLLTSPSTAHPNRLADMYLEITDDLAFAQTNYPDSKITLYLNGIAAEIYQVVYKNKKEKTNRFIHFWRYELPKEFFLSQKHLLLSFIIFVASMLIGIVSTSYDQDFPRVILGDHYVNMTLKNIQDGDPLAVYKDPNSHSMFYRITTNNIKVSFNTFISGILFSLGTVVILFKNGVMVGAFQWFFHEQGLFLTSFLTIWIHGALEISAIVIAGAAGFVLGNSILFPGTLPRMVSLRRGARRALKIIIGLIPIFITAGFLESYVTRLTDAPVFVKWAIILGSFGFIIFYFVLYPILLNRENIFPKKRLSFENLQAELETNSTDESIAPQH